MRPTLHARLLNGRTGDPCLYVEALHLPAALLFDCGDIAALSPRHLLRVEVLAISHTHMDHWSDFDRLLRPLIGREKHLHILGPPGLAAQVHHRLRSYSWNLVDRIPQELVIEVTEPAARTRFRLRTGFAPEALPPPDGADGPMLTLGPLRLRSAVLDHGLPCLGYVVEEEMHLNVWRNRLEERGLPTGPWLAALKRAVAEGLPDDHPIPVAGRGTAPVPMPLAALRDLVTVTPGQRIGYLTDFADTPANRAAAIALVRGADLLFIEAPFAAEDAAHAAERQHLTTRAAGEIARAAEVRRVEAMHFSPRYRDEEARLLAEVAVAAGL